MLSTFWMVQTYRIKNQWGRIFLFAITSGIDGVAQMCQSEEFEKLCFCNTTSHAPPRVLIRIAFGEKISKCEA